MGPFINRVQNWQKIVAADGPAKKIYFLSRKDSSARKMKFRFEIRMDRLHARFVLRKERVLQRQRISGGMSLPPRRAVTLSNSHSSRNKGKSPAGRKQTILIRRLLSKKRHLSTAELKSNWE